jgi:hypothetical protein
MTRFSLVFAVAALAFAAAGASPAAASYHSCSISGQQTDFPPASYVTSLAVSHTTCHTGKRVVRAFQKCRKASGGRKGHCRHRVLHYRCKERRGYGQGQYSSKVVCTRGHRRVRHTYTQFT